MDSMSKREFLKKLGVIGGGVAAGALFADEAPIGDPSYRGFCEKISDIPHSMEDVPSASLRNGKVVQHRIAVIAGDGIGPEVIVEGIKVLEAAAKKDGSFAFEFEPIHGSAVAAAVSRF